MTIKRTIAEATPKKVQVAAVSLDSRTQQIEQVLDNMSLGHGTGLMLAGPTGIGKTTFIKQLGRLLGMPVILVEAPHITEEHLINIPFIVFEPTSGKGKGSAVSMNKDHWHVQLGQSHLAAELNRKKAIPDNALLSEIRSGDANLRKLWSNMGGTDKTIPAEIADLRSRYRVILFLDEYFRQTSANVRNILRGILNGRIGNDRMPPHVYVVYASNLTDVGATIEQIPLNADFKKINYQPPTSGEFFHYLTSRFEADTGTALKPEVVEAFRKVITDKHVSYDDAATEIRTSPRRWEQIVLYVNANVPVQDSKSAAALLSSVKSMFQDGNQISKLAELTEAAVREIVKSTSGEETADTRALEASEWRDTLLHQVQTKMKLGDKRTYVPVVAGMPGIGKTAQAVDVAQKLNMLMVHIDCSTLTTDEITGIPIPDKSEGRMAVKFSEPALYKRIQQDIEEDTAAFMGDPNVSEERKKAFAAQPYKYLIFFDELNRVKSNNVFNSLRRVILEKSFNDETPLPAGSIVIAAMNPYDKGTAELTGHIKDATDYIDTAPSWKMTKNYLENVAVELPSVANRHEESKRVAMEIINSFVKQFTVKQATGSITPDSRQFYLPIGGEMVYVSPREYTTMLLDLIAGVDRTIGRAAGMDAEQYSQALAKSAWTKLNSTLEWILDKHQINSPQFLNQVKNWLDQLSAKFLIKSRSSAALEDILDPVMQDHSKHLKDDPDFVHYFKNFSLNKFVEDLSNYVDKLIKAEKRAVGVLMDTHPWKTYDKGTVTAGKEAVSKIEYLINELLIAAKHYNLSSDVQEAVRSLKNIAGQKLGPLLKPEDFPIVGKKLAPGGWKQINA